MKTDGALEQFRGFFGPLRFFDLKLGLVVPPVELALLAVRANRKLGVKTAALESKQNQDRW